MRGVKTLALRMRQHDANGREVAEYLRTHKKVQTLNYPGLENHPQHDLAKRQMSGFGSMMSLELGSRENANQFLTGTKLCLLAESLGGPETLVSHPTTMTHINFPEDWKLRLGITEGLVRISVGLEDAEDIIFDLEQALARI
jgi:cystathionine beta-lyase/cystathionine gamma-synthase